MCAAAHPEGSSYRQTALRHLRQSAACSLLAIVFLVTAACGGDSAQEQAYERAAKLEQGYTTETAPAIIAEYRKVIALEPGTAWAEKSEARISAVEARVKADEQHKDVFHEHGVD